MAPVKSPSLSQPASSQKRQQSISNFFTTKSTPAPKPPSRVSSDAQPVNGQKESSASDALFVSDNEDNAESRRSSDHFKRTLNTVKERPSDVRPAKRPRLASENTENEAPTFGEPEGYPLIDYAHSSRRELSGPRDEPSPISGRKSVQLSLSRSMQGVLCSTPSTNSSAEQMLFYGLVAKLAENLGAEEEAWKMSIAAPL